MDVIYIGNTQSKGFRNYPEILEAFKACGHALGYPRDPKEGNLEDKVSRDQRSVNKPHYMDFETADSDDEDFDDGWPEKSRCLRHFDLIPLGYVISI